MTKKIAKKEETKTINTVIIEFNGTVSLINYSSEKLFDGTVAINEESPNGKTVTHYVRCKWFNPTIGLEKGDVVSVKAKFGTDRYTDKAGKTHYNTIVIINDCDVFE